MRKFIVVNVIAFCAQMLSVSATALLVPSQYLTIQSAIVAATVGDTVLVTANATYMENLDFLGKDIVVRTPNPSVDKATTIIDANHVGSCALFKSNETTAAILEGFTLRNGAGTTRSWWYYLGFDVVSGGGILCDSPLAFNQAGNGSGSSPTLQHLIVENCAAEYGGGIAAWKNSCPHIKNVIIRNNTATGVGGGISAFEAFNTTNGKDLIIENCLIYANLADVASPGGGGIISNYTSRLSINNCTVADNVAMSTLGNNLFRANGAFFEIKNSIVWNGNTNLLYDQGGSFAQSFIDYSCVTSVSGPILGTNMVLNAPLFINQVGFDYHLQNGSPCIGMANVVNAAIIDLENNMRDANPDMGCYEVLSGAPVVALQSSDTSFCDKNTIDFFDMSTNNPTSWLWTFSGGVPSSSTLQNPVGIYYPNYGSFDVTLVACNANGCDTLFLPGFITEYPLPAAPVISQVGNSLCASSAYSYQWYLIPNAIPNATSQCYTPTQPGDYYVLISDSNGCEVPSAILTVTNTAMPAMPSHSNISLVETTTNLWTILHMACTSSIVVCNMDGQKVKQMINARIGDQINLKDLAPGVYVVDVLKCPQRFKLLVK